MIEKNRKIQTSTLPENNTNSLPDIPTLEKNRFTSIKDFLKDQFKLTIAEITFAGIFLALWIISSKFLTIDFVIMKAGITYIWMILIGLTLKPFLGIIICVLGDNLSLMLTTGFGQWTWAYAIIPIVIYLICFFYKKVFTTKNNTLWWTVNIFSLFLIAALTVVIMFLNKDFVKGNKSATDTFIIFNSLASKIVLWTMISLVIATQISFLIWYKLKKQENIRWIITIYSLVSVIIILMIWIWGPIANIIYLNNFPPVPGKTYWGSYKIYLFARILKTPLILPLYIVILSPIFKAAQMLMSQSWNQNVW